MKAIDCSNNLATKSREPWREWDFLRTLVHRVVQQICERVASQKDLRITKLGRGMAIEHCTAKTVADLFSLLPDDEKLVFIDMIASQVTAETAFRMVSRFSLPELERFTEMVRSELLFNLFPVMQDEARRLAREQPRLSDEEFDRLFRERIKQSMETYNKEIYELAAAKLKEQRDRKSDPEIVRRNVEICDLRKQDPKKWSYGMLGKKYDMTKQAIKAILKEESKWRRLTAQR
jgi:hypothetical protein